MIMIFACVVGVDFKNVYGDYGKPIFTIEDGRTSITSKNIKVGYKLKEKKMSLKTSYKGINKSYMDLSKITDKSSKQYKQKKKYSLDEKGHYYLRYKKKKFYVIALGSYFGNVGDKLKIKLESRTFYAIIGDEKASEDVHENYSHKEDRSVIEFIVNTKVAKGYYGADNGYVCNGNFNNSKLWRGKIIEVYKITN